MNNAADSFDELPDIDSLDLDELLNGPPAPAPEVAPAPAPPAPAKKAARARKAKPLEIVTVERPGDAPARRWIAEYWHGTQMVAVGRGATEAAAQAAAVATLPAKLAGKAFAVAARYPARVR